MRNCCTYLLLVIAIWIILILPRAFHLMLNYKKDRYLGRNDEVSTWSI